MKYLVLILTLLIGLNLSAQQEVSFNEYNHDFGLIQETGGKVKHRFYFINNSTDSISIKEIITNCGCTAAAAKKNKIAPNHKGFVDLTYNPNKRPGYFSKSAEIIFNKGNATTKRYINIKGFVVNKESIQNNLFEKSEYEISIAPFHKKFDFSLDTSFYDSPEFTEFINNLTYVIDADNFVTVEVSYYRNKKDNKYELVSSLKNRLKQELVSRRYSKNQIGFKAPKDLKVNDDNTTFKWSLYISVSGYSASETEINETNSSAKKNNKFYKKNTLLKHTQTQKIKKLVKNKEYQKFEKQLVRHNLTQNNLDLRINYFFTSKDSSKYIGKLKKWNSKNESNIRKSLTGQGVDDSKISFHNYKVYPQIENSFYEVELFIPRNIIPIDTTKKEIKTESIPEFVSKLNTTKNSSRSLIVDNYPVQNLPSHFQLLDFKNKRIDTTHKHFISMMQTVVEKIKEGEKIYFIMESSSSKAPTNKDFDNLYVSKLRGSESQDIIRNYLKNKGLKDSLIVFKEMVALITGPEYNLRYYLPKYYKYFQYLKVIPVYETTYQIKEELQLVPYSIDFSYNNAEIDISSSVFQDFIDKLANVIAKQGYVKLVVESSSSKVPTRTHRFNEKLAYFRAQDAKNKIYDEIFRRGINPNKVIIKDERILVTGPEYKKELEGTGVYDQYQYIKVIPYAILDK